MADDSKKAESETPLAEQVKKGGEKVVGQNPSLSTEITPSDVLKKQEQKK